MNPSIWTQFQRFAELSVDALDQARANGRRIAGIYCIFAPVELIRAAGAVPVGLCGKQQAPIAAAEESLPTALCPLIKSSYGYAVTNTCPFFEASDFIVGETTCDGKKKMFELMGRLKSLHLMQLPYNQDRPEALAYWHSEVLRLKAFLEEQTGNRIEADALNYEIRLHNRMRQAFQKLMTLNGCGQEPINGMRFLPVLESKGFAVDLESYVGLLDALYQETAGASRKEDPGTGRPRILLTGTPLGKGSEKLLRLIEDAGAVVVAMENCTGIKSCYQLVDENDPDPVRAIARHYLDTPCACMTPNNRRTGLIRQLIDELDVDGVVDMAWQCCHPYEIESASLRPSIYAAGRVPCIHISTDYSESDTGQLAVRIEAFLIMLEISGYSA